MIDPNDDLFGNPEDEPTPNPDVIEITDETQFEGDLRGFYSQI